jgi:hypothetical protein
LIVLRMYVSHALSPFRSKALRKLCRIAIWNRKKIISVIVMGIWVTDVALLIYGKYFLLIMGEF